MDSRSGRALGLGVSAGPWFLLESAPNPLSTTGQMTIAEQKRALACAVEAARAAGAVMRKNLHAAKHVNEATPHDIKLELDVRCQKLIETRLRAHFPDAAVLGEEGDAGNDQAAARWVIDPIDGTVNFAHGIPHACVSIALQVTGDAGQVASGKTAAPARGRNPVTRPPPHVTLAGVVYDPFLDEMWTARRGFPARLNGRVIHVSRRNKLTDALVALGFPKSDAAIEQNLACLVALAHRARKVRLMGSAALALTYVASGRFDAYLERGIRLWDIAAGGLIVECAGGDFWHEPAEEAGAYRMVATNGRLRQQLPPLT